ncbi:MAG: hypothetical protein WCW01_04550 [Gammaproteobacteria bacterium]
MKNEKERLNAMFQEKKISEADYKLLSAALEKKVSPINTTFSLLMNPFQKIAGLPALTLGLIVILAMSYLGTIAKVFFPGVLNLVNSSSVVSHKIPFSFLLLTYQNLVSWLAVTIIFLITARIWQQKRIRIIDFFGTVALSRFPFLILIILLSIIQIFHPSTLARDASKGWYPLHPTLMMDMVHLAVDVCAIWQITIYFSALKESSGLTGKKLWLSFIAAMIAAEAIAEPLTMIFF